MEIVKFKSLIGKHKVVGLDTSVFIYFLADHPKFGELTEIIFDLAERNKLRILTSIITPIEVLVGYRKSKDDDARNAFIQMIRTFPNIEIYNVSNSLVDQVVEYRTKYGIKTPDAIQLATAAINKAEVFITNDRKLKRVKEIKIICLNDFV